MTQNKKQHYVPKFYFKLFSKNGRSICAFNLDNVKFIEYAPIKNQCFKNYFYSKDIEIEKIFSWLEGLARNKIKKIINDKSLDCLSKEEIQHLKSHILFQHGRTKFAYDKEEDAANYLFKTINPKLAKKIKLTLKASYGLKICMLSGILLLDLKVVLLENKSKADFIFSDNPVILFNSFFNDIHPFGTTGLASRGLQIFYPINPRLMIFMFDPVFYDSPDYVKIKKDEDVQRLNGLQIINCNHNIYFKNIKQKDKILQRYNQIKSKKPKIKNEYQIMGHRITEEGHYSELLRMSSPKIKYNLEKLSFLKHKKIKAKYGLRNKQILEVHRKIVDAVINKKISSMEELEEFLLHN